MAKLNIITLILIVISCVFLIVGMCSRWYFVTQTDTMDATETTYSFYAPKINVKVFGMGQDSFSYSDLDLKSTHNYFNTCLAFCAIAFILGIVIVVFTALNLFKILSDKFWSLARILVIALLIFNFIGVCVAAGFTSGFKSDSFEPCRNACQDKFRGTFEGNNNQIIKFGGGVGFYLCLVSLFPAVGATIVSVLSFIIDRRDSSNTAK